MNPNNMVLLTFIKINLILNSLNKYVLVKGLKKVIDLEVFLPSLSKLMRIVFHYQ